MNYYFFSLRYTYITNHTNQPSIIIAFFKDRKLEPGAFVTHKKHVVLFLIHVAYACYFIQLKTLMYGNKQIKIPK